MIQILDKKDCCGCRACEQKCPKHAIIMEEDKEGFIYPVIDKDLCTECNLCNNVCPLENENINIDSFEKPNVVAAWNNNKYEREKGSSGGSFSAFAEYIFYLHGEVVGAGFDENLNVIHKFVSNIDELEELKGSKYVQSDIKNTFEIAKKKLEEKKVILYTGTPCQISGLRSFLGKEYSNLYTFDLVCHGVPSRKVYKKYLYEKNIQSKSQVKKIYFRDKTAGWKNYSVKTCFENGKIHIKNGSEDDYIRGFIKNIYLRPSCYECKFSKIPRYSDITLGDFWGVAHKYPELDNDRGTSLLLINTKKGKELLEQCKNKLYTEECELNYAIKYNYSIVNSVISDKNRDKFFEELDRMSFKELSKKYFPNMSLIKKAYYKNRDLILKIKSAIVDNK